MKRDTRGVRAAFTLIELLVVILIIGVIIAIVVPALGKARRTARIAVSRNLATQVVTSATTFQTDNRRIPGYYSAKDMGADKNGGGTTGTTGYGMSGMHNALIDLTGGPAYVGNKPSRTITDSGRPLAPWASLDPQRGLETAWVIPSTMGSGSSAGSGGKAYFAPPGKHFILPRENRGTEIARFGTLDKAYANNDAKRMPDLVDAFGTPVLWWGEDETVNGPFATSATATNRPQFAMVNSDDPKKPAKFYWNSNAAYLKMTSGGRNRADQVKDSGTDREYSLIGGGVPAADISQSMGGLLGNPSFADGLVANTSNYDLVLPSGGRGKFVLHGADPEGHYLGAGSNGFKYVKAFEGKEVVKFGYNYDIKKPAGIEDVIGRFEDIIATGGS